MCATSKQIFYGMPKKSFLINIFRELVIYPLTIFLPTKRSNVFWYFSCSHFNIIRWKVEIIQCGWNLHWLVSKIYCGGGGDWIILWQRTGWLDYIVVGGDLDYIVVEGRGDWIILWWREGWLDYIVVVGVD